MIQMWARRTNSIIIIIFFFMIFSKFYSNHCFNKYYVKIISLFSFLFSLSLFSFLFSLFSLSFLLPPSLLSQRKEIKLDGFPGVKKGFFDCNTCNSLFNFSILSSHSIICLCCSSITSRIVVRVCFSFSKRCSWDDSSLFTAAFSSVGEKGERKKKREREKEKFLKKTETLKKEKEKEERERERERGRRKKQNQ